MFPDQISDLQTQPPCTPSPLEWKGLGKGGFDPSLENCLGSSGEKACEHAELVTSSWYRLDASAQQTSAQWGLCHEGGCLGQGWVPANRLRPWGTNRTRVAPPQHAVPGWVGTAHPRSAGEMLATCVKSKGGQR